MEPVEKSGIRVIHVSFGLDVGGQEKLLVEFARHADRSRFALRYISLGDRGALAEDIEGLGCPVDSLGVPSGLSVSLSLRLARMFHNLRPAVVHTHDNRALFYAGPAARVTRVPRLVHTCHGRDMHATPRQVAIARGLSRLVDRYVCVSEVVRDQCGEQGIAGLGVCTILNGIDLGRFRFIGPDPAGPIVTVARLSPEKDIANLVRATAVAAAQAPDLRVEVAGGGPCRGDLDRLASDLGVADRVTFLGEVRDVASVLRRARLFVLPSRSEGIPLTVLEAMARGLPVVATRVGGVPEVIDDSVNGLLVPPADPGALAHAIMRIWGDSRSGDRMGHAGRRCVEHRFDIRRMVAEYEALYQYKSDSEGPQIDRAATAIHPDAPSTTMELVPCHDC